MVKKSDQLAGSFETENTGGLLTGLLADEEPFDRRAMLRLGTWGVASVGAVIIAVLANQSAVKARHDEIAALDLTRQSQQIQSVAKESQNEARRLAAAIDTLNSDRDRMYSRLTSVEQGLESVTGAIAKQNAAATPVPAGTPPAAAPPPPVPIAQAADPAPAVTPVATVASALPASEKPRADARKPAPPAPVIVAAATPMPASPAPAPAPGVAPASAANPPAATSAMPLMASRSMMSPPDPAAGKLFEPAPPPKAVAATSAPEPAPASPAASEVAAAPASGAAAAPPPTPEKPMPAEKEKLAATEKTALNAAPANPVAVAVQRTEFGVDVGGANSVAGLRALWRGLLKSRANAPLAALQPIIVVKEGNNGLGMQLRLVAGPLTNAAAAAKICASMVDGERGCETTVYDGQRLAMKNDDTSAAETISAKPSSEKAAAEAVSAKPASEKSSSEKSAAAKPGSSRQSSRHHGYSYSRRAAVEEPAPKPPEPSTLSSFFSSRLHPQQP